VLGRVFNSTQVNRPHKIQYTIPGLSAGLGFACPLGAFEINRPVLVMCFRVFCGAQACDKNALHVLALSACRLLTAVVVVSPSFIIRMLAGPSSIIRMLAGPSSILRMLAGLIGSWFLAFQRWPHGCFRVFCGAQACDKEALYVFALSARRPSIATSTSKAQLLNQHCQQSEAKPKDFGACTIARGAWKRTTLS
jgi:hypothetical protein